MNADTGLREALTALLDEWANDTGIVSPDSKHTRDVMVMEARAILAAHPAPTVDKPPAASVCVVCGEYDWRATHSCGSGSGTRPPQTAGDVAEVEQAIAQAERWSEDALLLERQRNEALVEVERLQSAMDAHNTDCAEIERLLAIERSKVADVLKLTAMISNDRPTTGAWLNQTDVFAILLGDEESRAALAAALNPEATT